MHKGTGCIHITHRIGAQAVLAVLLGPPQQRAVEGGRRLQLVLGQAAPHAPQHHQAAQGLSLLTWAEQGTEAGLRWPQHGLDAVPAFHTGLWGLEAGRHSDPAVRPLLLLPGTVAGHVTRKLSSHCSQSRITGLSLLGFSGATSLTLLHSRALTLGSGSGQQHCSSYQHGTGGGGWGGHTKDIIKGSTRRFQRIQ